MRSVLVSAPALTYARKGGVQRRMQPVTRDQGACLMVKWLILILAGYVLYRLFANDLNKKKKDNKQESAAEMERKVAAGEMVKDPECGAYVAVDSSVSVRDGDKVYRFCSYECRDKFLQRLEEGGRELPPREE